MTIIRDPFPRLLAGLIVATLVAGCTDLAGDTELRARAEVHDFDIVANSYQATERLLHGSQQPLDKEKPILVASLVNVANLELSSDFGRIVSEQIASRLTQLGYETREMKFRGSFLIRRGGGEFVLSRELRDVSKKQEAQAVITGVYAVAKDVVYVTLRLIRAEDSKVIASFDYMLGLGPNTAALLDPYDTYEY